MKRILIVFLLIACFQVKAQEFRENNMGFYLGFGSSGVTQPSLEGGPGYDGKGSFLFGLSYSRYLNQNFAIETGLSYLETEIEQLPVLLSPGNSTEQLQLPLELVNLRLGLKYSFLRFLFLNGGLLLDFEAKNEILDPQTGLGLGLGIGGEYMFTSGFTIFINPYLNQHAILPFQKENYHQRLLDAGIRLGLGYKF